MACFHLKFLLYWTVLYFQFNNDPFKTAIFLHNYFEVLYFCTCIYHYFPPLDFSPHSTINYKCLLIGLSVYIVCPVSYKQTPDRTVWGRIQTKTQTKHPFPRWHSVQDINFTCPGNTTPWQNAAYVWLC